MLPESTSYPWCVQVTFSGRGIANATHSIRTVSPSNPNWIRLLVTDGGPNNRPNFINFMLFHKSSTSFIKMSRSHHPIQMFPNECEWFTFEEDVRIGGCFLKSRDFGTTRVFAGHVAAHPESVGRTRAEHSARVFEHPRHFGCRIAADATLQRDVAPDVRFDVTRTFRYDRSICLKTWWEKKK